MDTDAAEATTTDRLRFRLLGPLEAERDGVKLDLGARKQRAVLALLLLDANRIVSTERLIDGLWGDAPPETARSALQVYVAGLRKALGEDGASLRTSAPGYVLDVPPGGSDLDEFATLRAEGRPREALALWRGPALADLDGEPFAAAAAGRLEEQRLGALEERIEADLAQGRHAEVVSELDVLVAEHPYRERFRAQQMLALYRSGRQADALAAYRSARTAFVDELGIEPGSELKALERSILDHDPALAAPPALAAVGGTPGRRKRRVRVAAAALLVVAGVAVAAAVLLGSEATPVEVEPNSVAVIDPTSNEVVDQVPAGNRPGGDRSRRRVGLRSQPGRKVPDENRSRDQEGRRHHPPRRQDADRNRVRPRSPLGCARPDGPGDADRSRAGRPEDVRRRRDEAPIAQRRRRRRAERRVGRVPRRDDGPDRPDIGLGGQRRDRGPQPPDGGHRGRRHGLGRELRRLDGLPLQSADVPRGPTRRHQRRPPVDGHRVRLRCGLGGE